MNYVPHTAQEKEQMLREIGMESLEALFSVIPEQLRKATIRLPEALSEAELISLCKELSKRNSHLNEYNSFLGAGAYDHFIPSIVGTLSSRGEFLTSYTPYQAEASQGTLQALYEFQTLICELAGLDVANASMYDGATALAEAALLAIRHTERNKVLISSTVHPEYRAVLATYLAQIEASLVEVRMAEGITDASALKDLVDEGVAAIIFQQPNFLGYLEEADAFSATAHEKGALVIACVNPISLGILSPPGDYGVDIAVGEAQPLGNPLWYGGPHVGFFAVKKELMRKLPGRLVGATTDLEGRRAFVLTLQAREQHIRRQRATSNICTNQNLLALRATIYLCALGKEGLKELAELNLQKSHYAIDMICKVKGFSTPFKRPFFNEFVIQLPSGLTPEGLNKRLYKRGIVGGLPLKSFYPELKDAMLFCVTENKTRAQTDSLVSVLKEISKGKSPKATEKMIKS
ncbi:MAG TPA: aminomethyl-transferring glycine dehydrogenase subunit GcvPA [Candidatus Hypogeohydataceae bacterium YC41]